MNLGAESTCTKKSYGRWISCNWCMCLLPGRWYMEQRRFSSSLIFFCGPQDTFILFIPNLLHQHATRFVNFFASFLLRAPATPHNFVIDFSRFWSQPWPGNRCKRKRHSRWLRLDSVSIHTCLNLKTAVRGRHACKYRQTPNLQLGTIVKRTELMRGAV